MVTHNKAKATVINQYVGSSLKEVTLIHKYSDVYVNRKQWGKLRYGYQYTDNLEVHFHTGFLTTGCDWWWMKWTTEEGVTYVTNPVSPDGFKMHILTSDDHNELVTLSIYKDRVVVSSPSGISTCSVRSVR